MNLDNPEVLQRNLAGEGRGVGGSWLSHIREQEETRRAGSWDADIWPDSTPHPTPNISDPVVSQSGGAQLHRA